MNIYLDIDGVLLANDSNLAIGAREFIQFVTDHFSVYWLTTHCMHGDPKHAAAYVQQASNQDLQPWLRKIKPTTWNLKKTEGIDFSMQFLWFDDDCYSGERTDLMEKGVMSSWIEVDLRKHPNQLIHELVLLRSFVAND